TYQMKLDGDAAALLCAAVVTMLFSFTTQHIDVTAVTASQSFKEVPVTHLQDDTVSRVRRQTKYRNKGFFSLIYDYFAETRADTSHAIRNISDLVSKTIVPNPQGIQLNTTDPERVTEQPEGNATTTEASFLLTQEEFFRLFRRNLRGLVRLFNMESRKAIQDSNKNVQMLRKQLKEAIRPYVQPANSTRT
ncbi:hypothetical protein L9F63_011347, partial [Diploptera punctata]